MSPERQRLETVYATHGAAVLAYARRRTDPATADDVLSEVFLVAWRRIDELPEQPRGWLLGIARKTLANHRRSTQRQAALSNQLGPQLSGQQTWPGEDDAEQHGSVLRALATLSAADRELLMLIAWDDLPPREAARVLGVSAAACTMRLSRARRRLATALERIEGGSDPDGDGEGVVARDASRALVGTRQSSAAARQRAFVRLIGAASSAARPAASWEACRA